MSRVRSVTLETAGEVLRFHAGTGALLSLRSKAAPDQEFIEAGADTPLLSLQYLDGEGQFHQVGPRRSRRAWVTAFRGGVDIVVRRLGGLDIDAQITVMGSPHEPMSRWSLYVRNGTDLRIAEVQFPFVICRYRLAGTPGSEAALWPFNAGVLYQTPEPQHLAPDCPHTWQMVPENGDQTHYPGLIFAQFLAYYNDRAGVYLACQDATGRIKRLRPVHRAPGLRLGVSHVGDWPVCGDRRLEYEVVLGTFTGDWRAAAELYRQWSLQQRWAQRPLRTRTDVPGWLLDSPPHVIVRLQGELDIGPAEPKEEFLPYPKIVPLLERLAARLQAPLVPVIMSWERPGPWIYPDCFPPVGGEDTLRQFCEMARERGWHIGSFCNGTRWVVGHYWSGYDGRDDFVARDGPASVCRTASGEMWKESWDQTWRPSFAGCLGTELTRRLASDFVARLVEYGLDWVQFLDQNVGCCTFPCFASDHEHPPAPGAWMTAKMGELVETFRHVGSQAQQASAGQRHLAFSVECPVNEYFLQDFQICDVRVVPPGHRGHGSGFIPLYHFLYHEHILIQGGFGSAPEPYHLPMRNAYNLVVGEIPGAVMKGDGTLLNYDTMNWAPWSPDVGSNEDAVEQLRAAIALRRGPARDFLVFGRMLAPSRVEGIRIVAWQHGGHDNRIPAVFHEAWQDPAGCFGLVLANWTAQAQEVAVADERLGEQAVLHVSAAQLERRELRAQGAGLRVSLPPLGAALLTQGG
ncbi:MAG: DUF6259 domain-containing protein [Candidatus Latescibacterota bacterium]